MRSMRGRVLYIRYKSPRVEESDLRQLATAFGKVTNLLVINPKVKNGHYQVSDKLTIKCFIANIRFALSYNK